MPNHYIDTIKTVIDYIEAHLTEKLNLDSVASVAHYSKYHLHRAFKEAVGLTPHEYLQRRQLTEAAKLLVFSGKAIMDIALLSGYESQQAFTNVFTAMYKTPPGKYRENERFYPLQLKFQLEGSYHLLDHFDKEQWDITFAQEEDIPIWMNLARLVIDGYPCFNEIEYIGILMQRIRTRQALIQKSGDIAIGAMLFSYDTGSIDYLGCHPLYRKRGLPKAFLDKAMNELIKNKQISITTFREGDRADTGHRRQIKGLGFAEAELLVEYGYPTQRFIIPREGENGE